MDACQGALMYFFRSQSLNMPVLTLSSISPTHARRVTLGAGLDVTRHPSSLLALRIVGPEYELPATFRSLLNGV